VIRGAALAVALLSSSCSLCNCDETPPVLVPGTYVVTDANEAEVLDAVAVLETDALTLTLTNGTIVRWRIE
jgi:hypothetical protein